MKYWFKGIDGGFETSSNTGKQKGKNRGISQTLDLN